MFKPYFRSWNRGVLFFSLFLGRVIKIKDRRESWFFFWLRGGPFGIEEKELCFRLSWFFLFEEEKGRNRKGKDHPRFT